MTPAARIFESFDVEQVLRALPGMARPLVQDFLRQNRIVLGHLFEVRDIPTPSCGCWAGEFTILGCEPHLMIAIYQWRSGELPSNVETTLAACRLLTGPADACVAAMVTDLHRYLTGARAAP